MVNNLNIKCYFCLLIRNKVWLKYKVDDLVILNWNFIKLIHSAVYIGIKQTNFELFLLTTLI